MRRLLAATAIILATLVVGGLAVQGIPAYISPEAGTIHAQWASSAASIADQVAEADIIVRVQVEQTEATRKFERPLPPEQQKPNLKALVTPFTDTRMRVLEVYKGEVGPKITVMQTGGDLPASPSHGRIRLAMEGDPLFARGSEHILFLNDITGDEIHGRGRQLYRIVNPAGRYDVQGASVRTPAGAELLGTFIPPTTLASLRSQIQAALT
jgi:hypothetical protein